MVNFIVLPKNHYDDARTQKGVYFFVDLENIHETTIECNAGTVCSLCPFTGTCNRTYYLNILEGFKKVLTKDLNA